MGVGSHSLLQENLSNPGIRPQSPTLQADSLPSESPGKPPKQNKKFKRGKKKKTQWVKVDSLTRTALINTIFNGAVRQGRKIFRDEVQESAFYEIFPHDVWPGLGITALEDSLSVRNDWLQSTAVKVKHVHLYGNCFPAGTKANSKTK